MECTLRDVSKAPDPPGTGQTKESIVTEQNRPEDDTEGQVKRPLNAPEVEDDTEGHHRRPLRAPSADDDTEGHVRKPL